MIRILKYTVKYINDEHGFKQKLWRRLYWEVGAWCLTSESTFVQDVKTGLTAGVRVKTDILLLHLAMSNAMGIF